ncbi:hypothetical protein FRB90_012136 [Tulasnella sp. 427]|nr:hypothetical protein FRB90_012136 [Tulasnella sp. 427]
MPYYNSTLCVPRGGSKKLGKAVVVDSVIESVPAQHVLIRVDKFGWSANNITYGILGEDAHFRYFDFHPAPTTWSVSPKSHGVIPVWGFGTVVESKIEKIEVGERVFGYFPSAKYMMIRVDEKDINSFNFYALRPHLPADRRPYNQITRCKADPLYNEEEEEASMLYSPLFWTSFWAEDWLYSSHYRNASRVLISSASSKTGFCLALAIKKRLQKTPGLDIKVIGLTSSGNKDFVESLGLYDEVHLYSALSEVDVTAGPYCYVDVAGNPKLNSEIISHLGPSMSFGVTLGMSHVNDTTSSIKETAEKDPEAKLEMFFMPEWFAVVRGTTSVKDIAELRKEGWGWIMKDGTQWVKLEPSKGKKKVLDTYKKTLKGSIGPDRGLIFSLWEGDGEQLKAKL